MKTRRRENILRTRKDIGDTACVEVKLKARKNNILKSQGYMNNFEMQYSMSQIAPHHMKESTISDGLKKL